MFLMKEKQQIILAIKLTKFKGINKMLNYELIHAYTILQYCEKKLEASTYVITFANVMMSV